MSSSDEGGSSGGGGASAGQTKYKGVRCRKWGKWVSEIRVPGTQDRLWLGSYSTPEAAAVAHDIASYCLRGPSSLERLNFPLRLPAGVHPGMSPRSVQKAASDAGMAVDAQFATTKKTADGDGTKANATQGLEGGSEWGSGDDRCGKWERSELNISVEDYL
ncbi:hypothetical protein U1Q18_036902 [Sarracenia purpurea var. burkii]